MVNTDRDPSSTKRAARMDAGSGAAHAGVGGGGEGCTDTWSVGDKVCAGLSCERLIYTECAVGMQPSGG